MEQGTSVWSGGMVWIPLTDHEAGRHTGRHPSRHERDGGREALVVALRGDLPGLHPQLRRRERRRHRRPAGLRSRLPYLADLGVDAIWINPWYPSPLADGGYDVADYRDIDPLFGTLDDAEALIGEAHAQGLKVVLDLVPNHTSDQHPWFRRRCARRPGSPRASPVHLPRRPGRRRRRAAQRLAVRLRRPGLDPAGRRRRPVVPAPVRPRAARPGLDQPGGGRRVRAILRFWLDLGVDGFRIDVAHGLAKDPAMPDLGSRARPACPRRRAATRTGTRTRSTTSTAAGGSSPTATPGDRTFVGEAWVPTPSGSRTTCAPTSCTPPSTSTS